MFTATLMDVLSTQFPLSVVCITHRFLVSNKSKKQPKQETGTVLFFTLVLFVAYFRVSSFASSTVCLNIYFQSTLH